MEQGNHEPVEIEQSDQGQGSWMWFTDGGWIYNNETGRWDRVVGPLAVGGLDWWQEWIEHDNEEQEEQARRTGVAWAHHYSYEHTDAGGFARPVTARIRGRALKDQVLTARGGEVSITPCLRTTWLWLLMATCFLVGAGVGAFGLLYCLFAFAVVPKEMVGVGEDFAEELAGRHSSIM